ncbi:hypothetical protein BSL78_23394 [Apostichopus japonicus]|uniref:C1q domain-containing protein n=1 Tax=Stichopus japonicus TaxID=307972 RepID=A0A2G8JVK9_STIJA|nr:hypothetical protein BSL78_23394 [Apostichopus japonicus]
MPIRHNISTNLETCTISEVILYLRRILKVYTSRVLIMSRLAIIFTFICSACFLVVNSQFSRRYRTHPVQMVPTSNTDLTDLKRQIASLESQVTIIRRENTALHSTLQQMNETMFILIKLNEATQNAKVEDLTTRVDTVEKNIDVIADQAGIEMTENELNRFLGNTEAQLVDLQTDPDFDPTGIPTIAPDALDDITIEQADLLGGALYQMNKQNEKLSSQVAALTRDVGAAGVGAAGSRQPETDLIQNRLNQLERIVVSQSAPKKGTSSGSSFRFGISAAAATNNGDVPTDALDSDEQEALQAIIEDARGGAVSMFSVARTGAMIGQNGVAQSVPYEMQLANKGGVYHASNGTFICTIAGYYFITFTLRTYDHKYLGVNLMKNSDSLTAIFSDKHARNVMQTQSIIIHLAVGDRLWLRMPPNSLFAIHSDQYHLTTFTGFLVYPGDP